MHLLALPYDIRFQIYSYLFPPGQQIYVQTIGTKLRSMTSEHKIPVNLLKVCKSLNIEAGEHLYSGYLFNVIGRKKDCLVAYEQFLRTMQKYAREEVHVDAFSNGSHSSTMCISLQAGTSKMALLRRRERGEPKRIDELEQEVQMHQTKTSWRTSFSTSGPTALRQRLPLMLANSKMHYAFAFTALLVGQIAATPFIPDGAGYGDTNEGLSAFNDESVDYAGYARSEDHANGYGHHGAGHAHQGKHSDHGEDEHKHKHHAAHRTGHDSKPHHRHHQKQHHGHKVKPHHDNAGNKPGRQHPHHQHDHDGHSNGNAHHNGHGPAHRQPADHPEGDHHPAQHHNGAKHHGQEHQHRGPADHQQKGPQAYGAQHSGHNANKNHHGPKHDGPKHDGPKHDGPKHDGPKHDGPKHDGPKHNGHHQQGQDKPSGYKHPQYHQKPGHGHAAHPCSSSDCDHSTEHSGTHHKPSATLKHPSSGHGHPSAHPKPSASSVHPEHPSAYPKPSSDSKHPSGIVIVPVTPTTKPHTVPSATAPKTTPAHSEKPQLQTTWHTELPTWASTTK